MEIDKKTLRSIMLGAVGCIVLYWLLHETERIRVFLRGIIQMIDPFIVGGGLAFILNVPMRAIERQLRRIPGMRAHRVVAILLTILLIVLIFVVIFNMLIPQLKETAFTIGQQLPGFFNRTEELIHKTLAHNPGMLQWVLENTQIDSFDWPSFVKRAVDLLGQGLTTVVNGTVTAVGGVISSIWNIFLAVVFALYCLAGKETLARQCRRLAYSVLPEGWADQIIRVLRLSNTTFSNFFSGQCLEVVILGALFAVAMSIFRMPYIPLVSVLVAITAFIPVVGAWIGCVLGAFFILVNDPMQAVWFVVLFVVLQQIENNLIYPRVVGTSIGLPSMWVLVAVTLGGEVMGVAGMMLMVPLASVVYTLLKEFSCHRVERLGIDAAKLQNQPPILKSKLKEKHEAKKSARVSEAAKKNANQKKNGQ